MRIKIYWAQVSSLTDVKKNQVSFKALKFFILIIICKCLLLQFANILYFKGHMDYIFLCWLLIISFNRCPSTFVGEYCQHPNPCHTSRCEHGGSCRVVLKPKSAPTFACDCPVGYTSSFCELEVPNACQAGPCKNNGVCRLKTLKTYGCNCSPGYRGTNCEHIDHCIVNGSNPCKNDAKCISDDTEIGYKCECDPGFTGSNCLQDKNECNDPGQCIHGTCQNTYGSYK